jgi:flagellar biosynthesis protein FliQ
VDPSAVIDIGVRGLTVGAELAAPMLITALVIGFAISVFQSITQIQETSLSFVPKLVGVSIALIICGQWMIAVMVSFTTDLMHQIPSLIGG